MSYVSHILQPNEKLVLIGRLHWIVYARAIFFFVIASVILIFYTWYSSVLFVLGAIIFYAVAVVLFAESWFARWVTEFAVTDRRVIYKRGFIRRHTAEMNMDKVESVDVDQSVLGRMLDYGTIHVLGTGQGIEHLHRIASPIKLRNAITAR